MTSGVYNCVRLILYAHVYHINVLNHFVYVQYGCGKQFEVAVSLNLDIITSFDSTSESESSTPDTYCIISQMSTVNEWGMTVSSMSVLMAYAYWWNMCSNSSMLGHTNSKLVKNRQKTEHYTHLKHWCHVWHAQRAGYGHFFKLSGYHAVTE